MRQAPRGRAAERMMMSFRLIEVDGVPTLVAPTDGPTVAGLVFRVGRADETLARSGLTHLLEHLALHSLGSSDYHYNGSTGPITTSFHTSGSGKDVAAFLATVCDSLSTLPMQRLETEKSIIRTEWSGRGNPVGQEMPLWRYGARGHGLLSYSEPGIAMITAAELDHWRQTWFTTQNAVLWIAGEVPAGLRLSLPPGQRWALPAVTSTLPITPAYFESDRNVVMVDAVVRHTPAVAVFAEVLERNLFQDLRQEGGLSYSANASSDPRGDGWSTVRAAADALPEKLDGALGGFVDVLARLRAGRIDEHDIAIYRAKVHEHAVHPNVEAGLLPSQAIALATGQPVRDLAQRLADLDAVTVADVHAVAQEVWGSALLMVPEGRRADWAGFAEAPTTSTETVDGARIGSRQSERLGLHLSSRGVSRTLDGMPTTVTFNEVAAMMAWPDGARRLIGEDAQTVHVEPTLWDLPADVLAQIDAAVLPPKVIVMPAREPNQIPQPTKPETSAPANGRGVWSRWELAVLIGSIVVAVLLSCVAGAFSISSDVDDGTGGKIGWGPAIGGWICVAVFLIPAVVVVIRRRARRR
jgi:zinc protease